MRKAGIYDYKRINVDELRVDKHADIQCDTNFRRSVSIVSQIPESKLTVSVPSIMTKGLTVSSIKDEMKTRNRISVFRSSALGVQPYLVHPGETLITWDSVAYQGSNGLGMFNPANSQTRITIQEPGFYVVLSNIIFDDIIPSTGARLVKLRENGSTVFCSETQVRDASIPNDFTTNLSLACARTFTSGDYIEVVVQGSGNVLHGIQAGDEVNLSVIMISS